MPWFSRASIVHVFIRKTHQRAGLGVVPWNLLEWWVQEVRTYSGVTRRPGYRWLVLFDPQFAIDLKREGAFTSNVCGLKSLSLILCWTNSRCCCDPDDLTFDLLLQASVARCASPSQASKSHFGEMNPSHACHTCKLTRWLSYPVLKESGLLLQYL